MNEDSAEEKRRERRRNWAVFFGVTGTFSLVLWPLLVALSFATTCTMGDDGSWATTLALCTILSALSLPSLLLAAWLGDRSQMRWLVPVVTIGPLLLVVGHMMETGFGTHHLCGPYQDSALEYGNSRWLSAWYYPIMWSYALLLSATAVAPLIARRSGRGRGNE